MTATLTMDAFRKVLPRLVRLHDEHASADDANFFAEFPVRIRSKRSATFRFYKTVERWLGHIPASQWPAFSAKIGEVVCACDVKRSRHWEQLHDVFNEAFGVALLVGKYGCDEISFLPVGDTPMPDLLGRNFSQTYYLEVKTINHSQDERESWSWPDDRNLPLVNGLPDALQKKIAISYKKAISQLCAPTDAASATKLALLVLNPDCNICPIFGAIEQSFLRLCRTIETAEVHILPHILAT